MNPVRRKVTGWEAVHGYKGSRTEVYHLACGHRTEERFHFRWGKLPKTMVCPTCSGNKIRSTPATEAP